jgi:hypothetical protein
MEFTQEKIKKAFDNADPRVQKILLDSYITEDVSVIGKKSGLRIDKIDGLIMIVGYVILNLIPISKLIEVIAQEMDVDREKATNIAEKIDKFVFTKVREQMKNKEDSQVVVEPKNNNIEADKKEGVKIENKDLKTSLISDIEQHAEDFEEPEEGQSFTDMFNNNKAKVRVDKKIDLYREES